MHSNTKGEEAAHFGRVGGLYTFVLRSRFPISFRHFSRSFSRSTAKSFSTQKTRRNSKKRGVWEYKTAPGSKNAPKKREPTLLLGFRSARSARETWRKQTRTHFFANRLIKAAKSLHRRAHAPPLSSCLSCEIWRQEKKLALCKSVSLEPLDRNRRAKRRCGS